MNKACTFSVEAITNSRHDKVLAMFTASAEKVWKEDSTSEGIRPQKIKVGSSDMKYMPWGVDNKMPYDILDQIEEDETINTCQQHNIKNCYAAGLEYTLPQTASKAVRDGVDLFLMRNDLCSYHLGVCTDIKFWQFAVTVLTLNKKGNAIASISRLESISCRFTPDDGTRRYVLYANWRDNKQPKDVQKFIMLKPEDPIGDLKEYMSGRKNVGDKQFALVTRIPTPENTYYPIPYYGSLFKGKWYDIKKLIALAKYSKLKNAAPLKYLITIAEEFWESLFEQAGATSDEEKTKLVNDKKKELINFLTGVENSGRVIFSGSYVDPGTGKEIPHIQITNLEEGKEGGDWETDIKEAINMVCFVMGVHSNLVGSVPGKSQSNNSGSDKRELYMIAQLLNKPTHDLLLRVHQVVCYINGWKGVKPECKIMQLTTLDQHKDIKQTDNTGKENDE